MKLSIDSWKQMCGNYESKILLPFIIFRKLSIVVNLFCYQAGSRFDTEATKGHDEFFNNNLNI